MKLLDLKTTKKVEAKGVVERIERIDKLHVAETDQAKLLNQKKVFVGEEMERLDVELKEHETITAEKVKVLTLEVTSLESRKVDALKPIKEQKKEAENRILVAEGREETVSNREIAIGEKEEEVLERSDSLSNTEQELNERGITLDDREVNIKSQEELNKQSTGKLNQSWTDFHKEVHGANASLKVREDEVKHQIEANTSFAESLNKKEKDLYAIKIQLQDERGMLNRAWEELKGKSNKK